MINSDFSLEVFIRGRNSIFFSKFQTSPDQAANRLSSYPGYRVRFQNKYIWYYLSFLDVKIVNISILFLVQFESMCIPT